ncbi:MAG: hypothetical protein ACLFUP_07630 [Desulfobacteraceae bacterium]
MKDIRKDFDPCFRYIVLARETSAGGYEAFSDILRLVGPNRPEVVDRAFYRDETSGTAVLVIKLRPNAPSQIDQAIINGRLPEDVVFYLYENRERLCENESRAPFSGDGD